MAKLIYGRSGSKLVKKYRCTQGRRKGRIVSQPQNCFGPPDIKKKMRMRRLRKQKQKQIARKTKKTKRMNPISKQVQRLNKTLSKQRKNSVKDETPNSVEKDFKDKEKK
ncbi:hypothetical protein PBI_SCTP2_12 [Salicola phage SCTP-2]|nr:hypothetical protein PBI_SCTP2_12 [Salicola phage SCTP-2]